jgi:hypothetical protein
MQLRQALSNILEKVENVNKVVKISGFICDEFIEIEFQPGDDSVDIIELLVGELDGGVFLNNILII